MKPGVDRGVLLISMGLFLVKLNCYACKRSILHALNMHYVRKNLNQYDIGKMCYYIVNNSITWKVWKKKDLIMLACFWSFIKTVLKSLSIFYYISQKSLPLPAAPALGRAAQRSVFPASSVVAALPTASNGNDTSFDTAC